MTTAKITKVIPWSSEMYGKHTFRVFVEKDAPEPDREWMLEIHTSLAKPEPYIARAYSRFSRGAYQCQWTAGTGRRNSCLKSDIPMIKAAFTRVAAVCEGMLTSYQDATKGALYMCHTMAKRRQEFYEAELEVQVQRFSEATPEVRESQDILTDVTIASEAVTEAYNIFTAFWVAYRHAPLTPMD